MILSIVICSYNRASYIGDALTSLYEQSSGLTSFEVIIVDNNSTDNTSEVFQNWRSTHPLGNFTYSNEKQQGAGDDEWHHQFFLVGVKTGRNKRPSLVEDHRQGNQEASHEHDLQGHHERRNDRGGDQLRAIWQVGHQRRG